MSTSDTAPNAENEFHHIGRQLTSLPGKARRAFRQFNADRAKFKAICADIALLPEGRKLLQFARRHRVSIFFQGTKELGENIGETENPRHPWDVPKIALNREYSNTQLAIILMHELRHVQQSRLIRKSGVQAWGLREEAFLWRIGEADAFTFQTVMALRLKQMGRPEFLQAMRDAETPAIRKFMKEHPPESFKDEQAFARGLFRRLLQHPHRVYTAEYLQWVGQMAWWPPEKNEKELPVGKIPGSGLDELYGKDFMKGLSMRALKAGVMQTWSAWDRASIRAAEKMMAKAEGATDQERSQRAHYLALRLKFRSCKLKRRTQEMRGVFFENYAAGHPTDGVKTGLLDKYALEITIPPAPRKPRGKALPRKKRKSMKR